MNKDSKLFYYFLIAVGKGGIIMLTASLRESHMPEMETMLKLQSLVRLSYTEKGSFKVVTN